MTRVVLAVSRLADDLDPRTFEGEPQSLPEHRVVIGEDDARHRARSDSGPGTTGLEPAEASGRQASTTVPPSPRSTSVPPSSSARSRMARMPTPAGASPMPG